MDEAYENALSRITDEGMLNMKIPTLSEGAESAKQAGQEVAGLVAAETLKAPLIAAGKAAFEGVSNAIRSAVTPVWESASAQTGGLAAGNPFASSVNAADEDFEPIALEDVGEGTAEGTTDAVAGTAETALAGGDAVGAAVAGGTAAVEGGLEAGALANAWNPAGLALGLSALGIAIGLSFIHGRKHHHIALPYASAPEGVS